MDPSSYVSGYGGVSALAVAVAYVIAQFIKSRGEKAKGPSGAITDASAANAILTNSLVAEQRENAGLRRRVTAAERRIEDLQHALETERDTHRTELSELHKQLDEVRRRLEAAEARYEGSGTL